MTSRGSPRWLTGMTGARDRGNLWPAAGDIEFL